MNFLSCVSKGIYPYKKKTKISRRIIRIFIVLTKHIFSVTLKIIPIITFSKILLNIDSFLTYYIVIALILFFKFRKRFKLENEYTHIISNEMAKIMSSLKKDPKTNDIDLQKVVLSKILKYLFTNFPKLNSQ